MPNAPLRGDCDRCVGLCCVAFAFDRSESFAFDKAADAPCGNLDAANRCTIHARLAASGFSGCVAYDCYGAGQVVTQEIFAGRSWRDDPALMPAMMETFRLLRRVHELRLLLREAGGLALGAEETQQVAAFARALEPEGGWTPDALKAFERGSLEGDVRTFLRSLSLADAHRVG